MPVEDRPLPDDFNVQPIVPHKAKPKPPRKLPGAVAKVTRSLKEGILNGAALCGYDGAGLGGVDGFLLMCAQRHPKHYMQLLGKLVPHTLHADVKGATISSVRIISVPAGHFLKEEDLARLRSPSSRLAFEPPPEITAVPAENASAAVETFPMIEAQSPAEARLLAELDGLTDAQLMERAIQCGLDPNLLNSS
jgi:hypothetical protein